MTQTDTVIKMGEIRVLVCLSGSPSSQKVIRTAARFAMANQRALTALYVDNGNVPRDDPMLRSNMELARSLGASVEITIHKHVPSAIIEYVQKVKVTDLFIGYSGSFRKKVFHRLDTYMLVRNLSTVDVHIIPDAAASLASSEIGQSRQQRLNTHDFMTLTIVMTTATILSVLFDRSRFSNSNIITIYILAVLITSVMTAERVYGIIAAVLYILLFNFLFIDPRFSFLVYDPDYMVTYFVSIIASIITSNISSKMKQTMLQARTNAYQAQILLNASEQFKKAVSREEIARITASQLCQLLRRDIVFYPAKDGHLDETMPPEAASLLYGVVETPPSKEPDPLSRDAIEEALSGGHRTGWGTMYYPDAYDQFICVRTGNDAYGVIAVAAAKGSLTPFEENILLSIIGECALTFESEKNRKEREDAQIIAENERFRSKLLRSISHDLRTPLTSIIGNSANLIEHADAFTLDERTSIYSDIYEDSIWLIELVENLLTITRLEECVALQPMAEVVADVLTTAVNTAKRHKSDHPIVLECDSECLVALMDVPLILQVLNNLIANAVKHTPPQTMITIRDWREGNHVMVCVADKGPGIPDEEKSKIFDLFYTGKEEKADNSRSLGLGLNLCKSILEAHGQTIRAEDNHPHGSVFIFSLPLVEENSHEPFSDTSH